MIKILLSAGHGAGPAHNRGGLIFNEGDNNFYYSLALKKELETYGALVDLVREIITDNPSVSERSKMSRGYDLFLDIHSNAFSDPNVRGSEIWDSVERPNRILATKILNATVNAFNHNNRGVKYREGQPSFNWYGVLRFNQAKSAMIIENGFHTNLQDSKYFLNNHKELAEVQSKAIAEYYGLNKLVVGSKEHWAEKHYQSLINKGITIHDRRFNDLVTRGEMLALIDRITGGNDGKS